MASLSKTAQVLKFFAQQHGAPGVPRKRLVKLAYMADVLARQYLGRPITQLLYIKDHYGPNARDLPEYTAELVNAELAEEIESRDGRLRWLRLRDAGRPSVFDFTLGETEILGYVAANYSRMPLDEFIEAVVKNTDPFLAVDREGEPLPMYTIDNAARNEIGFDLEMVAAAERQAERGEYMTLADFAHELRAQNSPGHPG